MRLIWLFKGLDFFRIQINIESGNRFFDVMNRCCTDNRSGNFRLGKNPCQSFLRHGTPMLVSNLLAIVNYDFVN